MGMGDQFNKLMALLVHSQQVPQIISAIPQIKKARLQISGEMANDRMVLQVESTEQSDSLKEKLIQKIRDVTKLRGEVEFVGAGTLTEDGKLIEDIRSYD